MTISDGISNASDSSLANIPTNTFEPLGIDESFGIKLYIDLHTGSNP